MSYDVIIIGGSYAGLQAAMTLGRALRNVLVIDSGKPCNRNTPYSHNFLTQDGETPHAVAAKARTQAERYPTVNFLTGKVVGAEKGETLFSASTDAGELFEAKKLLFTTGIADVMPAIPGFAHCWGISVIHCPYCHGYEMHSKPTGIIGNGDAGFEYAKMISNWSRDLTLFTNGAATFTHIQAQKLLANGIKLVETGIEQIIHTNGYIEQLVAGDNYKLDALYCRPVFKQHCSVPQTILECNITDDGYIKVDDFNRTSVAGVYAAGDCISPLRSVSTAVFSGTLAGSFINRELIDEDF